MEANKEVEIPFGAKDSELKGWEYTIPEGMEAEIKDGKIIVRQKESEDERIRKAVKHLVSSTKELHFGIDNYDGVKWIDILSWLEKQGEQKEQREHVWTLQDAAPGDILNSTRVQATIIFKGFNPDGKHIDAYCALQKGIFIHQELPWDMDFEPAPRFWIVELFRRMNESGYMWNPEMQELKKIEQNPAWSEEDEKMLASFLQKLEVCTLLSNKEYRWANKKLKTIKERVQPQTNSAWSEEDESWFKELELMALSFSDDESYRKKFFDWLKSLKERYAWKPSDEQMEYLAKAITTLGNEGDNKTSAILCELRTDLKKLIE